MHRRIFFVAMVVLAVLLSPAVFAGGGSEQQSQTATQGAAPVTVSIFMRDWVGLSWDNDITKAIEKATNTTIKVIAVPPADTNSKLNLLVASKQIPDIFQGYNAELYSQMWQNGIMLPLNKHWGQMPNLYKSRDAFTWTVQKASDGNVYQIPINEYKNNNNYVQTYRKDWLDKLGLSIPKTLDEYTKVALAVSKDDPNGDGKNDTYAGGAQQGFRNPRMWNGIMGAFGVQVGGYKVVNGNIVPCNTMPAMKDALNYLHTLYQEGAIDPEFATDDESRLKQKFLNGLYGAMYYKIFLFDTDNINNYHDTFYKNNPKANLVMGPNLTQTGYTPMKPLDLSAYGWLHTGIYADSKSLDGAMRIVDYVNTDAGSMLVNFGFKDSTYTLNSDGTITMKATQDQKNALGLPQWIEMASLELQNNTSKPYIDALNYDVSLSQPNILGGIMETVPETAKYGQAVGDYVNEQFTKMVAGTVPIDASWDNFVKEYNARGGAALTAAYDKAYKARQSE